MEGNPSFGPGSGYTRGFELSPNPKGTDAELLGNLSHAQPGCVEFDSILSVSVRQFSGHVFNLSTPYGYYTINGVYTGNTLNSYNVFHEEAIAKAHEEDTDLCARCDSSYDFRRCAMCASMDGQVIDRSKGERYHAEWLTFSKKKGMRRHSMSFDGMPFHACCRCVETVWRASWAAYSRNKREVSEAGDVREAA